MRTCVTAGQTSDHKGFDLVMGDDLPAPGALLADKGCDADRIRTWAEARDAIPVIPMRRNRTARAGVDQSLHALRNLVELDEPNSSFSSAGQTDAERLRGEFQWSDARRAAR